MRSFASLLSLLVTGSVFFASSLSQAATEWTIDSGHSSITFKIRHLISKTQGRFKTFEGAFTFDEKKPSESKVTTSIDTASIDTDNQKRDEHLRGDDFFSTDKFPKMEFVSTKLEGANKSGAKIHGNLTIKGVTKPVVLKATFTGTAKDPWGNERFGATATTKISRKDFGISWNKALDAGGVLLGDDVEISLEVEAIKKVSKP